MIMFLMPIISISFCLGMFLGSHLVQKWMKPLLDDQKKYVTYWFDSYMESRDEYNELYSKYIHELYKVK